MRISSIHTLALFAVLLLAGRWAHAGYEVPCYIDGGQSADGRYTVTTVPVGKITNHGPNHWQFVWHDARTDESRKFDAAEVQGGQIHAHLFVAPGGETFALFNHVTLWTEGKSDMHGAAKLCEKPGLPRDHNDPAFSRRIIIYSAKDGHVIKQLGAADFLTADEWENVIAVFNRVHWIKEYPGLNFKKTPRAGYAFYRVSPDYTVLEFQMTPVKASKQKESRIVRVRLTDGEILKPDEKLAEEKTPVRPFKGPDALPDEDKLARERYVPSLDPVRHEGQLPAALPPQPAPVAKKKE
jgi:hypothetical protein